MHKKLWVFKSKFQRHNIVLAANGQAGANQEDDIRDFRPRSCPSLILLPRTHRSTLRSTLHIVRNFLAPLLTGPARISGAEVKPSPVPSPAHMCRTTKLDAPVWNTHTHTPCRAVPNLSCTPSMKYHACKGSCACLPAPAPSATVRACPRPDLLQKDAIGPIYGAVPAVSSRKPWARRTWR